MCRPPLRNFAVTLVGVGAVFVLYDLHIRATWGNVEVDKPTLFARLETMWSLLLCIIPGVAVGFFVSRRSLWLSAFAYALGALIGFYYHGGNGSIEAGDMLPERHLLPYVFRELGIFVAIGAVMGLLGAWLRYRLTIGSSDRGSRLRSAKEGVDDWDKSAFV
jgi:hypothetical protein